MSDEISACPFCQSVVTRVISVRDGLRVYCADCMAEGPPIFLGPEGREAARKAAIAAWGPISPCPHIATSQEGTSYCRLAESGAKDAARYRWLRGQMFVSRNNAVPDRFGLLRYLLSEGIEESNDSRYIDAAIDAAITQPEKSP